MTTNLRPSVAILENPGTSAGVPLHHSTEGDSAAARNAAAMLTGKDASGNLQYLKLDAANNLSVVFAENFICLDDEGTVVDGSATFVDIATIVLANSKTYRGLEWHTSCFRDYIFELVWIDDVGGVATEAVQVRGRGGSQQFDNTAVLKCKAFTTAAANTQHLVLRARNINALSDIDGTVSVNELI
jgi:hypothetical protein